MSNNTITQNKFDFLIKLNGLFDQKEKAQFLGVIIVALVATLFQTLSVASVLPFISLVMDQGALDQSKFLKTLFVFFDFSSIYSFTVFLGIILIGIIVISNFLSAFSTWFKIRFVWQKNHNLSLALLRKYLFLPYVYFLDKHSADLGKNILSEVEQLTGRLFMPLLSLITSGIMALIIFVLLLFVNLWVTLIAVFLFIFFYGVIFFYLRGNLKERGGKRIEENPPITENFKVRGNSVYGCTKLLGELAIKRAGIPYIILRYAHLYGEGKLDNGAINGFISRMNRGLAPVLYGGKQSGDFTYIKDIVQANILALESDKLNETYNIGTGEELTTEDVFNQLKEFFNYDKEFEKLPLRVSDPNRFVYDISKAKKLLNYNPQYNFKKGMED